MSWGLEVNLLDRKVRNNTAQKKSYRRPGASERKSRYNRAYHASHRDRINEAHRVAQRQQTNQIQQIKLQRGCVDCGYNAHAEALEFDHLSGKTAAISQMRNRSMKVVLAEIAKCEVRCANCHRVKTAERRDPCP
jgi:aerobic-type carbon monoxide dehydrogenase small subunit (CoxS/CutS family)